MDILNQMDICETKRAFVNKDLTKIEIEEEQTLKSMHNELNNEQDHLEGRLRYERPKRVENIIGQFDMECSTKLTEKLKDGTRKAMSILKHQHLKLKSQGINK